MEGLRTRYDWAPLDAEELSPSSTQRGGGEEQPRPRHGEDPYVEASFALGVHPPLPPFPEDGKSSRRLVMKRKVLRHRPDGGVEVSDESVSSEQESDSEVGSLRHKMLQLRMSADDSISEGEIEGSSGESLQHWPCEDNPSSLLEDFGSQSSLPSQHSTVVEQPKSFIPPRFEPLGRNRGKTDRVAKYLEYKREWEKFRIPGQEPHQELRWSIREQMLCKPDPPLKSTHVYVPNTYVVPTDKKRAALRWEGVKSCD
ncbi:centriolar and ciliogenesis-associated protein HYLS1 isoform X2 [Colius striatus]|uniref:centriolar and ciliogenesis-associated protein HYLS1 isoform X2 n=1 Tax=Colius striatus TaxID=57412 RepID=UPI002B1E4E54|nr:centriolar and ciliogenesis-associated protein HYLS1 isoform X2 [Colius striatus]XP_061870186.1 centriolar and ciliogenesis-associated protein HYLS1 isoform X2 [Colius striatus]